MICCTVRCEVVFAIKAEKRKILTLLNSSFKKYRNIKYKNFNANLEFELWSDTRSTNFHVTDDTGKKFKVACTRWNFGMKSTHDVRLFVCAMIDFINYCNEELKLNIENDDFYFDCQSFFVNSKKREVPRVLYTKESTFCPYYDGCEYKKEFHAYMKTDSENDLSFLEKLFKVPKSKFYKRISPELEYSYKFYLSNEELQHVLEGAKCERYKDLEKITFQSETTVVAVNRQQINRYRFEDGKLAIL